MSARENDDGDICPSQLEVIRRGVELWTNPCDVVLSPFAGIGNREGYVSIQSGRRSVELKQSYYRQAVENFAHGTVVSSGDLFAEVTLTTAASPDCASRSRQLVALAEQLQTEQRQAHGRNLPG